MRLWNELKVAWYETDLKHRLLAFGIYSAFVALVGGGAFFFLHYTAPPLETWPPHSASLSSPVLVLALVICNFVLFATLVLCCCCGYSRRASYYLSDAPNYIPVRLGRLVPRYHSKG